MRMDKMTIKLQEALQEAISFATESGHQSVEPEHLLYALLRQQDSLAAQVLDKLGLQSASLIKIIEQDLRNRPSVSGANVQVYFSSRMNKLFNNAAKEADALKDEFISAKRILGAGYRSCGRRAGGSFPKRRHQERCGLSGARRVRRNRQRRRAQINGTR